LFNLKDQVYTKKCKLGAKRRNIMRATAKDLRFHSKELIEFVSKGEEIVITYRGKPCAKLVPYQELKGKNEKNELFGMWENDDATENVKNYVRNLRKSRF